MRRSLQGPAHHLIYQSKASTEVADFADLMRSNDLGGACDRIDALRSEGRSLESIYLDVLAPAASHLRDLWSDDFCGFADVTLALCNLQAILRLLATDFLADATETGQRTLLVAPQPSDDIDVGLPVFGLMLMAQFFRRDGWEARIECDMTRVAARGALSREWFDLVEIMTQSDKDLDRVAAGIRAIRRDSPNRSIGVIVCGQVFADHPEFVRLVGADLMATDPLSSLAQAKALRTAPHTQVSYTTPASSPERRGRLS
jgi:hypothetical protein